MDNSHIYVEFLKSMSRLKQTSTTSTVIEAYKAVRLFIKRA